MVTSWTLRARSAALAGGAIVSDWAGTLVERYNAPDTLQVNGRTDDLAPLFTTAGVIDLTGGVTLNDDTGRRFSGPLSQFVRRGDGTCSLTYESDLIYLWDRIVYPTPTAAITAQTVDYGDVRTGAAETVLLAYINAQAGPGALTARRVTGLTVPTSLGRGGTISLTSRLDNLGELVGTVAEAASLRVTVLQSGTSLVVTVTATPDLSSTARYGTPDAGGPGLIGEGWTYTINKPDVTTAEIAGGGEGTARVFRERIDTAAQTRWARRVEQLVDQRQTSVTGELDKAGDDALLTGSQPVEITAPVFDSPDLRLGVDVPLGALVALDLAGSLVVDRLRQVTTTISASDGDPTAAVEGLVGSADAGLTRDQKRFLAMSKQLRKVVTR